MVKHIALLCPTPMDKSQIARISDRLKNEYEIEMVEDTDHQIESDVLQFIDGLVRKLKHSSIDGICSANDYPGILIAAALVRELEFPIGYNLLGTYRCSHKYYSRLIQSEVVPDACPTFFTLVNDSSVEVALPYPVFLKPVKSCLSQNAQRINNVEELRELLRTPRIQYHLNTFVRPFNQLIERYLKSDVFEKDARYMLAEELLSGHQFTVDGYIDEYDKVVILGFTDTVMHSNQISYLRFDHPTNLLPLSVQERVKDVCNDVIKGIELKSSLFNIEFYYNEKNNEIKIIEINPRQVGLFADMYEMVHGQNTYEIMMALATGQTMSFKPRQPSYKHASSIMLHFSDYNTPVIVTNVPSKETRDNILKDFPMVSLLTVTCDVGTQLNMEDRLAYGYGYINICGNSMEEIDRNFHLVKERLGFQFQPLNN